MRYIASNCLREGMKLARPLYRNAETMLAADMVLNEGYIASIQRCGFPGVYIYDDLSADLDIHTMISDELRHETAKRLSKIVDLAASESIPSRMPDIGPQVESIVDELFTNKDIMVNMLDLSSHDNYTCSHALNVAVLSLVLAMGLGFTHSEAVALGTGALLHDIGKVFINKAILQKNGPLTEEEMNLVRNHPKDGFDYISRRYSTIPMRHCSAILEHHERYDGTGYPYGKAGTAISLHGRICAVADVYDALVSSRPYRGALPPSECVEYVMGGAETIFDPKVVDVFAQRIAPYPVGTSVVLSNGWVGLVVENYVSYSLRPKLRIYEQEGQRVQPFDISLKDDFNYLNVTITGTV